MVETKKYVMLITFTATIFIWLLVTPMISAMSVTEVTGIKAEYTGVNNYVECTGAVTAENGQTISYGYALKPEKIYVKVGDSVKAGDKLMDIDQADTLDAFRSLNSESNAGTAFGVQRPKRQRAATARIPQRTATVSVKRWRSITGRAAHLL